MLNWLKRRRREREAYKFGQDFGKEAAAAIDSYLLYRLPELHQRLLQVVRERLATIYDDTEIQGATPQLAALAEWQIFLDNVTSFSQRVVAQTRDALPQVYETLRYLKEETIMDQYIEQRANETKNQLVKETYLEVLKAFLEAEKKQPIPDGMHLIAKAATEFKGLAEWVTEGHRFS